MAGWRVGMLLGKKEFLDEVLKVKTQMDSGMFYGIQKGAIAALKIGLAQSEVQGSDWFQKMDSIYKQRRKLIWKIADTLNCSYDKTSSGMFVWAKLPEGISSESMVDDLLYNKDIFIAPGTIFGSQG